MCALLLQRLALRVYLLQFTRSTAHDAHQALVHKHVSTQPPDPACLRLVHGSLALGSAALLDARV